MKWLKRKTSSWEKCGAALAEAERAGAAGVDDDTRFAVIPDEIAGGGALVLELRAAGARTCTARPFAPQDCAVAGEDT